MASRTFEILQKVYILKRLLGWQSLFLYDKICTYNQRIGVIGFTMRKVISIVVAIAIIAGMVLMFQKMASSTEEAGSSGAVAGGLIINEVMTNNQGVFPDDEGNNSDWVELYNTTDQAISLSRYGLSDDEEKPVKWAFPRITIEPHSYMVVYLTGDSNSKVSTGILHCNFKLSAEGETLVLSDSAGNKADSVAIPALLENVSYGLIDGTWQETAHATPGYENTDAGYAAFMASRSVQDSAVIITEVMAANAMTIADPEGSYSDWIEVANVSGDDYDLSGCGLSDAAADPLKWRFPDVTLKAGQSLMVFCSGRASAYSGEGPLEADFKLSSNGMVAVLSDASGRVMDSVSLDEAPTDWSYARAYQSGAPTDAWVLTSQPTPGYPNTADGFVAFAQADPFAAGDIIISEVLCSNNQIDFNGSKSDYIEIENRGTQAVNLSGYGLTNDAGNPAKFRFPDVTLQPGGRIVVLANGYTQPAETSKLSAPFKLSRLGTTLALFNAQDQLTDRYFIGEVPQNISVGREKGASAIAYFETPTPGAANGDGKSGIASEVEFSQAAGKYDSMVQLTLTASEGCDIYYTTDGSIPTEHSKKYIGPISVGETTSVQARAYRADYIPSGTATATYLIDTQHTLSVVSITTEYSGLFDTATGIYANSKKDTEVPASFELFDESGQCVFQQDIGLAMTGGMTLQLKEQKSFAIYARSKYGESTMAYPFFENRDYTEYKSLILRTAGREGAMVTKLNNYVALGLVDGQMNVMTQAAKPCVVYIDGKYWGVYFLMEKRNKYMVAQYEDVTDPAAIDSINLTKGLRQELTSSGSYEGYAEIFNYIKTHDLSIQENYDWVDARLDTDSYMDFMINEIYIANNDPGNVQYYQAPGGKWKQIYQDMDIAFYSFDALALRMDPSTSGSDIFNALLKNEGWRNRFIERFAWALKNIYNTERVTAAIDEAAALLRGEVEAEHARWSGERPTLADWEAGVNGLKYFAKVRPAAVVSSLKQHFSWLTQAQINMLEEAAGI